MRHAILLGLALWVAAGSAQARLVGLPDCPALSDKICRVNIPPNMTELLNRLSGKETTWWREGDRFTIAARRKADSVELLGVFHESMTRVANTDFWFLTVKSPLLDRAIFDVAMKGETVHTGKNEWRGPDAPATPKRASYSKLHVENIVLDSPNLGEKRKIAIYLPPGYDPAKRYPVVYLGDGQNTQWEAQFVEPLITSGKIPSLIMVGPSNSASPITVDGKTMQRRTADYILNHTPENAYFLKHEAFFLKEVMPLAESKFGASPRPEDRLLTGRSASADWAVDTALRHPDLFGYAVGLSPSVPHDGPFGPKGPKLFLTNSEIMDWTDGSETAAKAKAAGEDVVLETHVSGHANVMWDIQLTDALIWAFGGR